MALVAVLGPLAAGCGSGAQYANQDRPPTPIVITAEISNNRVSVSPDRFGGGPIELVVTNQDTVSHQLTLETNQIGGTSAGIQQQTGPINPQDTASLKADLLNKQGTYSLHVGPPGQINGRIAPATLYVGPNRPTAQNQLLQP
ncbi:MAG TPA: hypothetical protein VGY97_02055 [Solirubrobacteraceae bacterium]|nr:hypothetical protein [Solirubrobacteraceae bacterium]